MTDFPRSLHIEGIQPFHGEIMRISSNYLSPGAPHCLPLTQEMRTVVLQALNRTTHPSALAPIAELAAEHLRYSTHPKFIAWSITNCNPARTVFLKWFGTVLLIEGVGIAIVLILSDADRWWRLFAFIPLVFGVSIRVPAAKSRFCLFYHYAKQQQLQPWEGSASLDKSWIKKIFDDALTVGDKDLELVRGDVASRAIAVGLGVAVVLTLVAVAVSKGNLFS